MTALDGRSQSSHSGSLQVTCRTLDRCNVSSFVLFRADGSRDRSCGLQLTALVDLQDRQHIRR